MRIQLHTNLDLHHHELVDITNTLNRASIIPHEGDYIQCATDWLELRVVKVRYIHQLSATGMVTLVVKVELHLTPRWQNIAEFEKFYRENR